MAATKISREFRDNQEELLRIKPAEQENVMGVRAQIPTIDTSKGTGINQNHSVDMGRINLVSMGLNDPSNVQNLPKPEPKALGDIGYACQSVGNVMKDIFSLGNTQDNNMEDPVLKPMQPAPQMGFGMRM